MDLTNFLLEHTLRIAIGVLTLFFTGFVFMLAVGEFEFVLVFLVVSGLAWALGSLMKLGFGLDKEGEK